MSVLFTGSAIGIVTALVAIGWGVRGWCCSGRACCRRCRYPIDLGADRCQECGALLRARRALATGRVPRWRWIGAGALLLVVSAGAMCFDMLQRRPQLKPDWLLLWQIRLSGDAARRSDWAEAVRRLMEQELDADEIALVTPVVRRALDGGGAPPFFMMFLDMALAQGKLADGDIRALARACTSAQRDFDGIIGPIVPGRTVALRVGGWSTPWGRQVGAVATAIELDGRPIEFRAREGLSGGEQVAVVWLPDAWESDRMLVSCRASFVDTPERVVVLEPGDRSYRSAVLLHIDDVGGSIPYIEEVDDPTWLAQLSQVIRLRAGTWRDSTGRLRPASVRVGRVPPEMPSLSFDVFWSTPQREIHVESFSFRARNNDFRQHWLGHLDELPESTEQVDIILRSNLRWAEMHPGIRRVWVGEHRVRGVRVERGARE